MYYVNNIKGYSCKVYAEYFFRATFLSQVITLFIIASLLYRKEKPKIADFLLNSESYFFR